ncbi:MAG: alpha/beta fold hydrolase, partial [Geminicoccaceae bacterium]|nr:alpha/beta fold hydrolase [Geminicoccaceae bacterium]
MIPLAVAGCRAWFHPARGGRAVLICPPWGFEALCAQRGLKILADLLAARGLPCLRLDYPGTAESLDPEPGSDLLEAWLGAIEAAARALTRLAGASELALIGTRLGALLAAEAAHRLANVATLVLLAPPSSGRAYVRELEAWARLAGGGPGDHGSGRTEEGGLLIGGFVLDTRTVDRMRRLDPLGRPPPVARALVLERPDARRAAVACAVWKDAGIALERAPFTGLEDWLRDPLYSDVPRPVFGDLVERLAADPRMVPRGPAPPLPFAADARLTGPTFIEEPVRFGAEARLTGVLALPRDRPSGAMPPALLLLNAGAVPRVGPGRSAVELARALAGRGFASLRIDLGGIGDSDPPPGCERLEIYRRSQLEEVAAAIDLLERHGMRQVVVAGLCSGAFLAFHAALRDPRIAGLVLLNLPRLRWRSFAPQLYLPTRALLARLALREICNRPGETIATLRVLAERLGARAHALLPVRWARALAARSRPARWLASLERRGVAVLALFSEGDPGLASVAPLVEGRRGDPRGGRLRVEVLAGANHTLSDPSARPRVAALLSR